MRTRWIFALANVLIYIPIQSIDPQAIEQIGKKIWHNECGGSKEKLLFWSPLEQFPSLGVGHFIWYPEHYQGPYTQGFPDLVVFIRQHKIEVPAWLNGACPWSSRELFYQSMQSPRMEELRTFLENTIDLQAAYMIKKLQNTIPDMMNAFSDAKRGQAQSIIDRLSLSCQGLYVLVDYLNFKGSGLNVKERYNNQGWGLMQVLEYMIDKNLPATPASFALSAEHVLRQRVANAPPGSPDGQRLAGCLNRIKTYVNF